MCKIRKVEFLFINLYLKIFVLWTIIFMLAHIPLV